MPAPRPGPPKQSAYPPSRAGHVPRAFQPSAALAKPSTPAAALAKTPGMSQQNIPTQPAGKAIAAPTTVEAEAMPVPKDTVAKPPAQASAMAKPLAQQPLRRKPPTPPAKPNRAPSLPANHQDEILPPAPLLSPTYPPPKALPGGAQQGFRPREVLVSLRGKATETVSAPEMAHCVDATAPTGGNLFRALKADLEIPTQVPLYMRGSSSLDTGDITIRPRGNLPSMLQNVLIRGSSSMSSFRCFVERITGLNTCKDFRTAPDLLAGLPCQDWDQSELHAGHTKPTEHLTPVLSQISSQQKLTTHTSKNLFERSTPKLHHNFAACRNKVSAYNPAKLKAHPAVYWDNRPQQRQSPPGQQRVRCGAITTCVAVTCQATLGLIDAPSSIKCLYPLLENPCHDAFLAKSTPYTCLCGGMESHAQLANDLFQLIEPIPVRTRSPETFPAGYFHDVYSPIASTIGDISSITLCDSDFTSPTPSWIGAQNSPVQDQEVPQNYNGWPPYSPSIAVTIMDSTSDASASTVPWRCPSPASKRRKFENSSQNSRQTSSQKSSNSIEQALLYEEDAPSPILRSSTASIAASIQEFLEQHGPYPGWEYDEYPQSFGNSPSCLSLSNTCSGDDGSGSPNLAESRIYSLDLSFWDFWEIDSDNRLVPRDPHFETQQSYGLRHAFDDRNPYDDVPYRPMVATFGDPRAESEHLPTSVSSHPSCESLLQAQQTAAALPDCRNDDDDADVAEANSPLQGGAKDEVFQPVKADVSKLVQKLKCVEHNFAPKQIRMLLVSDQKFMRKIERTSDAKQLLSCVQAAATRMGLLNQPPKQVPEPHPSQKGTPYSKDDKNSPALSSDKGKGKGYGKETKPSKAKGKGKDATQNPSKNGKGQGAPPKEASNPQRDPSSKAKGKGKTTRVSYTLEADGWNVMPLTEFATSHGGIYLCEQAEKAKRIAEQGVGKPYPIGVLTPFPMEIGIKEPEIVFAEFTKTIGDHSHKITTQAYLHQITYTDVVYRKTAPVVNIKKPAVAQTSDCYMTISDNGACAQAKLEMQQKRLPAFKQWVSSLLQQNPHLEILDIWNVQELSCQGADRIYQISARISSNQLETLLSMSGPGKLQVNVPGSLRTNMHIWLKKEGRPMTSEEVQQVLHDHTGSHLGAFVVRGTWAIRTLDKYFSELKQKLGRNEDPAYFLSNVPPEIEINDIRDLLRQLKWQATVKDGERRWRGAGYTWLIRSTEEPRVYEFPITFGYERRMLRIQAARKPKPNIAPTLPEPSILQFPTWNAQCRTGKQQPKSMPAKPSFAEVLTGNARKRFKPAVQPPSLSPLERDWISDEEMESAPAQISEVQKLQEQLALMSQQNQEQNQTIQQLMKQIADLTAQLQILTAQSLSGGNAVQPNANSAETAAPS